MDALDAALHVAGVDSVTWVSPTADIVTGVSGFGQLMSANLSVNILDQPPSFPPTEVSSYLIMSTSNTIATDQENDAAVSVQKAALAKTDINSLEGRWGTPRSLLPLHVQTKLDHAQEITDAARYPLPFGEVVRTKDPYACSASILPFLAWERSTDLWKSTWDDAKKRYVVDQAFIMQRKKGTRWGVELYVSVMGGRVIRLDAPPLMAFPGRPMTDAERVTWLSQFPTLRLYPFTAYGNSQYAFFSSDLKVSALDASPVPLAQSFKLDAQPGTFNLIASAHFTPDTIAHYSLTLAPGNFQSSGSAVIQGPVQTVPGFYPKPSEQCVPDLDLILYLGNRTDLVEPDGTITPCDFYPIQIQGADGVFTEYKQVVLPSGLMDIWFAGEFPRDAVNPRQYLMVDGQIGFFPISLDLIAKRIVTSLQNNPPTDGDPLVFSAQTVSPGQAPISVVPDHIFKNGPTKPVEWYLDRDPPLMVDGQIGFFPTEDRATYYIYDVLYLYNPKDVAAPVKLPPNATMFADFTYLDFPAFTARATIEIFGTLPKCDLKFWMGDGFLTPIDMSPFYDSITAVRASKSARDSVFVDTRTYDVAMLPISFP